MGSFIITYHHRLEVRDPRRVQGPSGVLKITLAGRVQKRGLSKEENREPIPVITEAESARARFRRETPSRVKETTLPEAFSL